MSVLYLDTSALVKLYVREKGSALTKKAVEDARLVATSRIAWVEAHSAFARRHREKGLSKSAFETARKALRDDWPFFLVVEFGERIALRAAQLVESHAIRGFDAIHVASALELGMLLGSAVRFLSFDEKQQKAAVDEGLQR